MSFTAHFSSATRWQRTTWPALMLTLALALAFAHALVPSAAAQDDQTDAALFGKKEKVDAALIGILYDLKMDQSREPIGGGSGSSDKRLQGIWDAAVTKFLNENWNEAVLNEFYRVTNPLYATRLFVPSIKADVAPRAFGVEKLVKPTFWLVHYKGQVRPPADGTYRFVGSADNVVAVAINQRTVLVALHSNNPLPKVQWKEPAKGEFKSPAGHQVVAGEWVTLRKDEVVDLDILCGERPGGSFSTYLFWQKQGETYEQDSRGNPILPIVRMDNAKFPPDFRSGIPYMYGEAWDVMQ